MANTEGFARTYDARKPPTSPSARPRPTAMTNPPVGTLPHPSREPNRSLGTTPNPSRMANRSVGISPDPGRMANGSVGTSRRGGRGWSRVGRNPGASRRRSRPGHPAGRQSQAREFAASSPTLTMASSGRSERSTTSSVGGSCSRSRATTTGRSTACRLPRWTRATRPSLSQTHEPTGNSETTHSRILTAAGSNRPRCAANSNSSTARYGSCGGRCGRGAIIARKVSATIANRDSR